MALLSRVYLYKSYEVCYAVKKINIKCKNLRGRTDKQIYAGLYGIWRMGDEKENYIIHTALLLELVNLPRDRMRK